MAYISSVNEKSYTIETGTDEPRREIVLNGLSYSIDWQRIAPLAADAQGQSAQGGQYSLLLAGKSYTVFARRLEDTNGGSGARYEIEVAGQRFEVGVEDERERALTGSLKSANETGEIQVRAPMPGLVLGVLKEPGEPVERGETVVVLEAMKMENDLATPRGGTVKEVRVGKGQTVNQGDILLVITGE